MIDQMIENSAASAGSALRIVPRTVTIEIPSATCFMVSILSCRMLTIPRPKALVDTRVRVIGGFL